MPTGDYPIFVTQPPAPQAPSGGSIIATGGGVTLSAGTCALCAHYEFQISADPSFVNRVVDSGVPASPQWTPQR